MVKTFTDFEIRTPMNKFDFWVVVQYIVVQHIVFDFMRTSPTWETLGRSLGPTGGGYQKTV